MLPSAAIWGSLPPRNMWLDVMTSSEMTGHISTGRASCGLHSPITKMVNNASSDQIYFFKMCMAPWSVVFTPGDVLVL